MDYTQVTEVKPEKGTWGYYNFLPDELKLEVLKHAVPRHGAHHFIMKAPEPPEDEDEDEIDTNRSADRGTSRGTSRRGNRGRNRAAYGFSSQVLDIVPYVLHGEGQAKKLQTDDSAWMGIWNIGWTLGMSRELITEGEPGVEIWSRQRRKNWDKKEEPNKVKFYPDRDLLIISVASKDFEITNMDPPGNRRKFRHVKRVGINFFHPVSKPRRGKPQIMSAFYCVCRQHKPMAVCPRALCDFMRFFSSLEELFIVYPVNKRRIDQKVQQGIPQRGQKRNPDGEVIEKRPKFVNKNAGVLMEDTMNKFKGLALKHNLAIFEDRKKSYYEVREDDCTEFVDHDDLWGMRSMFRSGWTSRRPVGDTITEAQWSSWLKVKVGVLVCQDRVKDPWKVNAIVNNEIEPAKE